MIRPSILLGKLLLKLARLRGGGSAFPGLIVEKTDPHLLRDVLSSLPLGVVLILGTNGKTTTTKMTAGILEGRGLRVFTNKTGSNFVRGILSSLLDRIRPDGSLDADIAVLELDEAHSVRFLQAAPVDYVLVLNVQRDQLDRYCEIDHTAALLGKTAAGARKAVILNREDPLVRTLPGKNRIFYGLSQDLKDLFPSDQDLLSQAEADKEAEALPADVVLEAMDRDRALYRIGEETFSCSLSLEGAYNAFNAAGALALCRQILPDPPPQDLLQPLSEVTSAFGRGEILTLGEAEVRLLLVKNPSAFRQSLLSFGSGPDPVMIVINDFDADGRDISWLWNVDFSGLEKVHTVSGTRAPEMALRLKYDQGETGHVNTDLPGALRTFMEGPGPRRIFATYTAMLEIRRLLTGRSLL